MQRNETALSRDGRGSGGYGVGGGGGRVSVNKVRVWGKVWESVRKCQRHGRSIRKCIVLC